MTTALMNFNKNSNIGLYVFVTNEFALVGREVHNKELKELRRILEVPMHTISIAGTSLVGFFLAGNEDLVLVPSITFDHELEKLKKLKINYSVFESDFTCLGNNISLTKHGALVNPEFPDKEVKLLEKTLKVPVKITSGIDII